MDGERPDLAGTTADVVAYIERLEQELAQLRRSTAREPDGEPSSAEPSEPLTPINVVTVTRKGVVKRTPRHFYTRQRRGGMASLAWTQTRMTRPAGWSWRMRLPA